MTANGANTKSMSMSDSMRFGAVGILRTGAFMQASGLVFGLTTLLWLLGCCSLPPTPPPSAAVDLWRSMTSGTTKQLNRIWGSGPNDVFAVGLGGIILHYDGNRWSTMRDVRSDSITSTNVWGSGPNDVYVLDNDSSAYDLNTDTTFSFDMIVSSICRYDGSGWSTVKSDIKGPLMGIWGSDSNDIFAVGFGSKIFHYDGLEWSSTDRGPLRLLGVWGSGPNDVFAVGDRGAGLGGVILHYSGEKWSEMSSGTTEARSAVWGSGPADVWTFDWSPSQSTIMHYDGVNWLKVEKHAAPFSAIGSVWGSGPKDVWAVGWLNRSTTGVIHHYKGSEWKIARQDVEVGFNGIWGSGPNDVFVVGGSGTILHSTW